MAKVKTACTRTATPITGTLSLYNQRDSGDAETPGPTWGIAVGPGNVVCYITRVYYDYAQSSYAYRIPHHPDTYIAYFPSNQQPTFAEGEIGFMYGLWDDNETTGPAGTWPAPVLVKLPAGVSTLALDYSMQFGCQRLYRERTSTPSTGRDASPVYAHETQCTDTWEDEGHPWPYVVTFGGISWYGTQRWVDESYYTGWDPYLSAPGGASLFFAQNNGSMGTTYADVSVKIDGTGLDFSGGHKAYGDFALTGDGDKVSLSCTATGSVGNPISWGVTAYLPWMVDFSGVSVKDRDGNSVNVRLSGGFKADPRYPETLDWSTTP